MESGPHPENADHDKPDHDSKGADQAKLLGDDREDEVGVSKGQEPILCVAAAEPKPGPPTLGDGPKRLQCLVPGIIGVSGWIEEREEPLPPPRSAPDHQRGHEDATARKHRKSTERGTSEEHHRHDDGADNEDCPEVGLKDQQKEHEHRDGSNRADRDRRIVHRPT